MRVTFFARVDTALNPYLLLYKEALEHQGIAVRLERELNLKWLIAHGRSCDAIHLHWMEAAYRPKGVNTESALVRKLLHNRFVSPLRGISRLAGFWLVLFLAKLQQKRIVYTVHNLAIHGRSRPNALLHRLAHQVVLPLCDQIHAHNLYTRDMLAAVYKRKRGISVVPLGNYVGYYPNEVSRAAARRQLGLTDAAFVYLFFGLLRPYKGVEELIEAFQELNSPTSGLFIVGSAMTANYQEEIERLSRSCPGIRLVPEFVPDDAIQVYMNACDICVLPYRTITTSSAVMLALSFGRPVIVPAIGSFPELITPDTGMLYDPAQRGALAYALHQAGQRPWSEPKILAYASEFRWHKLGPRLAALYGSTPNGQPADRLDEEARAA